MQSFSHMWLSTRCRNWICIMFAIKTSLFFVNLRPLKPVVQRNKGVRQDDLLSPKLFLPSVNCLSNFFQTAYEEKVLSRISRNTAHFRVSRYADDVVIFTRPNSLCINRWKSYWSLDQTLGCIVWRDLTSHTSPNHLISG